MEPGSLDGRASLRAALRSCRLCPRSCGVDRTAGERGVCGAGARVRIARAALHFWEEPCISGTSGSGTVFFSYCPVRCVYCQNRDIALGDAGTEVSVRRLARIYLELAEQGARNVNLVTPTHYAPQVVESVRLARAAGLDLPIVYNTSGYELPEAIALLRGTVDVYLSDYKYADARTAARYSNAPDYPEVALAALEAMVEQAGPPVFEAQTGGAPEEPARLVRGVVVRHLLLPGCLEESKRAVRLLHERFGGDVLLSIMNQYTPAYRIDRFPELNATVPPQEYEALLDYADALGVEDYFWQEGGADSESFIPPFDRTGVDGPEL